MQSLARSSLRTLPWSRAPFILPCRAFRTSIRPKSIESAIESKQWLRVRVTRPPAFSMKTLRRALLFNIIALGTLLYFSPVSIEIVEQEEVEEKDTEGKNSEKDDDETASDDDIEKLENNFFIPLSLPSEREREYYTGEDPEWQIMMKFSADTKLHEKVHRALAMHCRHVTTHHPMLNKQLGKVDVTKGRYWMETTFPYGPPPVYQMFGLELDKEYIALAARPMSQEDYYRYQQFTSPANVLVSIMKFNFNMYDFYKDQITQVFTRSKQIPEQGAKSLPEVLRSKESADDENGPKARSGEIPQKNGPDAGRIAELSKAKASEDPRVTSNGSIPDVPSPKSSDIRRSMMMLMNRIRNNSLRKKRPEPPPGCVRFWGLVEVLGTRGMATLEVISDYDIEEKAIRIHSMSLRNLRPRSQSPKGGAQRNPKGKEEEPSS